MAESLQNQDNLLRYIDGEMTDEERMIFEKELSNNEALRQELESLQLSVLAIQQHANQSHVARIHNEMVAGKGKPAPVRSIKLFMPYVIGIAAAVMTFAVVTFLNREKVTAEDLYNEGFVDYQYAGERSNDSVSTFSKAFAAGNYQAVVDTATKQTPANAKDSLLTGISFVKLQRDADAIHWLEPLVSNKSVGADALFYNSMAHLHHRDIAEATSGLQKIHNDPSNPYHDRITEDYLNKLKQSK